MKNINNKNQYYGTQKKELEQQKRILKAKLAVLCTALGITGMGIYYHNQSNQNMDNQITKENSDEFVNIFQEENLINGKWEKGRIILTNSLNSPIEVNDENRVVFLGIYEGSLDNLDIEIDSEYVSIDNEVYFKYEDETNEVNRYIYQEENLVNNEWAKGDITITAGLIPESIIDKRYLLIDTSFDIEIETSKEKSLKLR